MSISLKDTANITTANWGTARTITIGKTGKSVNGSGNVSWATSEILHQGTITTQDWNTANVEGIYEISSFSGSNSPTGAYKWGGLLTLRSGNVTNQVYLSHNHNEMWIRGGWNGSWNDSWSRVYTTSYKPSLSDIGAAASSHTHNYAGSLSAGGAANSATKLATARTINGTNFDGTGNITTANWGTTRTLNGVSVNGSTNYTIPVENYYCTVGADNTKLYHRMLATDITTANYVDKSMIIVVHGSYLSGGFGIAKIALRTNNITDAASSYGEIKWLVRNGIAEDALVFNLVNKPQQACIDVFYKSPGIHASITWYVLSEGTRGGYHSKQWTKYSSNANNGVNSYTLDEMLALREYTTTLSSALDAGHVSTANLANSASSIASRGNVDCENGVTARPAVDGISMSQVYNNEYPTPYGNVISLRGQGDGQILVGWSGNDGAHAPVYVRSKRDNTTSANWSEWAQLYSTAHKPTPSDIGAAPASSTSLNTTDKTIVGAINEVFQSGNSVKQNLVDTLIAKGAEDISTSNSWDSLIDMIEGSNINLAPASFTVEKVSGSEYGFRLLGSGPYYESENMDVHGSYAMCKLNIVCNNDYNVYLDCISYGESSYDYGIISQINTPLLLSNQADTTGVLKSFKGESSSNVQSVQLSSESGFYYIKYIKDNSISNGNDSLRFAVRFQKKTGGNPDVPENPGGEETILFSPTIGGDNRNLTGGYTRKLQNPSSHFMYDASCMDLYAYSYASGGDTLETVISNNRINLTNYSRLRIKAYFTTSSNDSGGAPRVGFDAIGNRDEAYAASTTITSSAQRYYDLDISGLTGNYHLKFNVATSLGNRPGEITKHLYITELILYP